MIGEQFRVGDLVKFNPEKFGSVNKEAVFSVKHVTNYSEIVVAVVRHNDESLIGTEVNLNKSWLCRAAIKSKFERRAALCR